MNKYSKELTELINKEKDYDKLLEVSYSCSGDMNGNLDLTTLNIDNKILKKEVSAIHSDPIEVKEYSVSEEDINKIKEYIDKYNFPMWKDLEYEDFFAYDAPTRRISFTYDNSKIGGFGYKPYSVDFNLKIPDDGRKVINEFKSLLESLAKEENKIKEYIKEVKY